MTALAEKIAVASLHGMNKDAWKRYDKTGSWFYEIHDIGFKYNLSDVHSAIGLAQLKKSDQFMQRRSEIARAYSEAFKGEDGLQVPYVEAGVEHAWHLYVLRLRPERLKIGRNQFVEMLRERGVGISVHCIPLHTMDFYQKTLWLPHRRFSGHRGRVQPLSLAADLRRDECGRCDLRDRYRARSDARKSPLERTFHGGNSAQYWSPAGPAFSAPTSASGWSSDGHDVICLDNFFTSQKSNVAHLLRPAELRVDPPRHHAADLSGGRRDLQPGLSRRPGPLPVQPHQDDEDLGDGGDQRAGHGQALPGEGAAGLDQRGLRRSRGPSPARKLSRRGQSDRPAGLLRRRQAGGRNALSWTTTARTASTSASCGSSTPTARACTPSTAAWSRTSSRQALAGEDITIFGDGSQTRSFCYRDDLIEGMIRMMNGPDDFIGPVNLGNPDEFTIRAVGEAGDRADRRPRSSSTSRSRPTIRRTGSPTSRWPRSISTGNRRFRCATG